MTSKLDHALNLMRRGFRIFPLIPNGKTPLTDHGHKDASADESTIRAWWGRWPNANIGIATGRGLVVLDFDVKGGGKGLDTLDLLDTAYDFPDSARVTTASGGLHVYLSTDPDVYVQSRTKPFKDKFPDMDIKADSGYVVGPGSTIDGKEYV